jgi:ADP-ribose pyrophosphatase
MHVYLASGLYYSPLAADADEFLQVQAVPMMEVLEMAQKGLLPDAKTLAALWMARGRLDPHLYGG